MTETTAGGALDEVMAASRPVIYPTAPTRRADMLNDRAYDLASDPKPQPRPPLTVAQLRLLGTGVALVSVYIGSLLLSDMRAPGAWHPLLPTLSMIVGNLLLVAGGVSDNWPAHLSIRASARPAHMREATWVFVRSGRILLLATGAFASLPILALIEMFTVQILRVLLQR